MVSVIEEIVVILIVLFGPGSLIYAWKKWHARRFVIEEPKWRGYCAVMGLFATTTQAVFWISSWVYSMQIGGWQRHERLFSQFIRCEEALFLVVVGCMIAGKANY